MSSLMARGGREEDEGLHVVGHYEACAMKAVGCRFGSEDGEDLSKAGF